MTEVSEYAAKVFDYHETTKHRFDGYAKGPETIDWEAQPDLFRHFKGAPVHELVLQEIDAGLSYANLSIGQRVATQNWSASTISRLLQFSLALSAWKQFGTSRWSLRCNPSSGNLHPTECYLLILGIDDFTDGLYHYRVGRHHLELRCRYSDTTAISEPLLLLGFSSVHWREAWKYGERAYRYCQLDLGHALAAIGYACSLLGYQATPMLEIGTVALQQVLGVDRTDEFYPDELELADLLVALHPAEEAPTHPIGKLLQLVESADWYGRANRLDTRHLYAWPLIEEVAIAAQHPAGAREQVEPEQWPAPTLAADHPLSRQPAQRLFLQRRSAQAFDANGGMATPDFFRMMDRLLPRDDLPPWSANVWQPRLHLALFIHGVAGIAPGLYFLIRSRAQQEKLKTLMREDLLWEKVDEAPPHLLFYRLALTKVRRAAMQLSCLQDIAGDSAFSLSMLAQFESTIIQQPWSYDELFWEAGMIGQSLYLEAEAIGLRGTGIGCFFDDGMHEMLGIKGKALQAVYHFTVGVPINDSRLATLPPYPD